MRKIGLLAVIAMAGAAWADGGQGTARPTDDSAQGTPPSALSTPPSALSTKHSALITSPWHFRIGPVMAPHVRTHISGPRVTLPTVPRDGATASGTYGTAPAAPSAGYVKRDYVNGHVYPDEGTDDPGTMTGGLTWNWGADDVAAQHDNGRVSFDTGAGRWVENYSSSSYGQGANRGTDDDTLLGFEAMGGWTFWENATFDAALDAGFRFYGSDDADTSSRYGTTVTTTRRTYRYIDSYDASGWTSVPRGSYEGTAGGSGRLLGATPERSEEFVGSSQSSRSYYSSSRTKLDYTIWDLRLGPTFGWHVTDWFQLRGGAYGLLGLVDAELKTETNDNGISSHAKSSKCTPLFGMAFSLMAQANLTDWCFLYGAIEYDWWTDKVSMDAGGSHAVLEMSDYSVSAGIGFEF